MASDGSVEIRISASTDASLQSSVNATKAALDSVARSAQAAGISTADAFRAKAHDAIVAAGNDLSKLTPEMLGIGASAQAASATVVSSLSAAEAATGTLRVATAGAIQEYIRLGHEAVTGNLSRMPGSLVVLASRMGGLTGETLAAAGAYATLGAAVAVPVAAMAVMAYRQYEARKEAEALAEGFALSGRGALYSSNAIQAEIDALTQLKGVSRDTAQQLLQFDATHADLNGQIAQAANQLIPAYVEELGKKAPDALNQLKAKLAEISTASIPDAIREFEALNKTTLNLPAAAVPAIETMIRSGNGLGAALQIVADQALGVHVPIATLGERIKTTTTDLEEQKHELALLTDAMGHTGVEGAQVLNDKFFQVDLQVQKLTGDLQLLKGLQAAFAPQGPPPINAEDRYLAQLKVQASLAGESARQRHVDEALIERATKHLEAQGLAEKQVVTSAEQARKILGDQADITAKLAAAGYKEPKGPNVPKQNEHIGDERAAAEREAGEKRIEGEAAVNAFLLQMGQRTLDAFVAQAIDLENKRYAIELKANQDRQKADASDRVALAKDKAQEQVIEQDHANRLAEIDRTRIEKAQQMRATDLQDFERTQDAMLGRYIKSVDAQYAAGQISAAQRAKLEQDFTNTIEAEVLKRFDAEHAGLVKGTEAYNQAIKDRTAIVDGFSAKFETTEDKLLSEDAQKWKTFSSSVTSSFNSALDQLVVHGGTFRQFLVSAVQGVESAFLSMGAKIAEDWIANQIRMMLTEDVSLDKFLANETAKAAAVLDGQATQVSAVAAGSGAKGAIEAAGDSQSILNSAYTAAAKAYTSVMQSVPPPFNLIAAPVVATATFGAVAAYDVISAAGGLERVAYNGQIIQAHVDEAVLPASIARPLFNLAQSGVLDMVPAALNVAPSETAMRAISLPDFGRSQFADIARAMGGGSNVTHNDNSTGPVINHTLNMNGGARMNSDWERALSGSNMALEKIIKDHHRKGTFRRATRSVR